MRIADTRAVAALTLGFILGSSLVQAHTWQERQILQNQWRLSQLDARHWRQESLRLRDELALINRRSTRETYVQSVNFEVVKSPVPLIDIEAALEPYTESLLGLPLASIKLTMVYHLINNRRLTLGNHIYRVEVRALLISPNIAILLDLHQTGRSSRA